MKSSGSILFVQAKGQLQKCVLIFIPEAIYLKV